MISFKSFLSEMQSHLLLDDKSNAADYEAAIVMGYYSVQGKDVPSPSALGISQDAYERVNNNVSMKTAGVNIASKIITNTGKGDAKQIGASNIPTTNFWRSMGANDTTPKTDIIINGKKISLKIGDAQLMSGKAPESLATFYAAIKSAPGLINSKEAQDVISSFDSFVTSGITGGGSVKNYTLGKYKGQDEVIAAADAAHKIMQGQITALFEKSQEFKIAFIKEAMSGEFKFGDGSDGMANYCLVGSKNGNNISYHSLNDKSYLLKVASVARPQVRFKSNSVKNAKDSVGANGEKAYRYYSVVSIGIKKLVSLDEEINTKCNGLLLEGVVEGSDDYIQLREGIIAAAWSKFKSFMSALLAKVKSYISSSMTALVDFLGFDIEVDVRGNDSYIQFPL